MEEEIGNGKGREAGPGESRAESYTGMRKPLNNKNLNHFHVLSFVPQYRGARTSACSVHTRVNASDRAQMHSQNPPPTPSQLRSAQVARAHGLRTQEPITMKSFLFSPIPSITYSHTPLNPATHPAKVKSGL